MLVASIVVPTASTAASEALPKARGTSVAVIIAAAGATALLVLPATASWLSPGRDWMRVSAGAWLAGDEASGAGGTLGEAALLACGAAALAAGAAAADSCELAAPLPASAFTGAADGRCAVPNVAAGNACCAGALAAACGTLPVARSPLLTGAASSDGVVALSALLGAAAGSCNAAAAAVRARVASVVLLGAGTDRPGALPKAFEEALNAKALGFSAA